MSSSVPDTVALGGEQCGIEANRGVAVKGGSGYGSGMAKTAAGIDSEDGVEGAPTTPGGLTTKKTVSATYTQAVDYAVNYADDAAPNAGA
jgi:hypothetical protein